MWKEMARIISEVRPKYAFVENSPMLTTRGLGTVLSDFSKMGFDAEWGVLSAADVGANHLRERIWIVAKSTQQPRFFPHAQYNRIRWWEQQSQSIEEKVDISNTNSKSWNGWLNREFRLQICGKKGKWGEKTIRGTDMQLIKNGHQCTPIFGESPPTPEFLRMVDGVAASVDRLKAIGNGQVPLCAATAWNILKGRLDERI
jgi:DNA (cytosine-5)-methyltransferase 1